MRVASLPFVVIAMALSANSILAQSSKPGAPPTDVAILSDATLFRPEFAKKMMDHAKTFEDVISTNVFLHWSVPDPAPSIQQITAKYGKPRRASQIRNQTFNDEKTRDATIHWYGRFGFVVASGNTKGTIEWVAWE